MEDTQKKCPKCQAALQEGTGVIDQTGAPKPTVTWTCLGSCGYKRWDALPSEELKTPEPADT
jgi:RNase P subunit RPR2